jgi:hypothetical protein
MVRVTIDTGPWLDLLDRRGCVAEMEQILSWYKSGTVRVFASSRVFDPDTDAMYSHQRSALRSLLDDHAIEIAGAPFRLGVSRLGGPDPLGGQPTARSPEDLKRFTEVVGPDPSTLPASAVGKAFGRKVGDYDALHAHFATGNDVFVTLDTKDYLHTSRRGKYAAQLGLIVQSPAEFVAAHAGSAP